MLALCLMVAAPVLQQTTRASAMPTLQPLGPALAGLGEVASVPAFAECEAAYRAEALAWQQSVSAHARGELEGELPAAPEAAWYPRFRALADAGDVRARLWCLAHAELCGMPVELRPAYWRGEAYGLATALREEPELCSALLAAAGSGALLAGEEEFDEWLGYFGSVSPREEIQRAALARRAAVTRFAKTPAIAARRVALEDELIRRWPESQEAQRLLGRRFSEQNLQIGMVAPEFAGQDVDGRTIRLSDYRGKLVVLDFWGFW